MRRSTLLMIVAALVAATKPAAQERMLVLEGGTLIDGTGRAPVVFFPYGVTTIADIHNDQSNTFGGTHYNSPRQVSAGVRIRFHY